MRTMQSIPSPNRHMHWRQKNCMQTLCCLTKCAEELTDDTICFTRSVILNRLCPVAILEDLQTQGAFAA